jgi:hypothetical protein
MKLLNVWRYKATKNIVFYENLNPPVYINGDWAIYKEFNKSYLYAFKNIAVNNLGGLNKDYLDSLAKNEIDVNNQFNFFRAKETLEIGFEILNENTIAN